MSWSSRRNRHRPRPIPWGNIEPTPEYNPNFSLDRQIAEAKAEIGPERWAELQAEWDAKP
ncbi:MAG: hypothetical protein V4533_16820 [Pseudomonadota bacterium]